MRQGRVDLHLLVVSKALVREGAEAYAAKLAHVELAEKLRQWDERLESLVDANAQPIVRVDQRIAAE